MGLWAELRRRRVFRFAGVYIVGAWVVFQVGDVFFPAWGIPETALRYLLYAAIACFPFALAFSWFYDVTKSGITRTPPADNTDFSDSRLKGFDYFLLAGIVLASGVILFANLARVLESQSHSQTPAVTEQTKEAPDNALAVLPFESLDNATETGLFSDGVSEEILHRLASVRALKVVGRQSSFAFGDSDIGTARISAILGVSYLLSGTIRRSGDQVRVTATLLDDEGYQKWSESFDGDLSEIFQFQSDIAERVASEITRELIHLDAPPSARTTDSNEAYHQYLIGREYFNRRPDDWGRKTEEAFRKAIAADPHYAPPYAGLSMVIRMVSSDHSLESVNREANRLIDKALELDPLLAEAWMARGYPNQDDPEFDYEAAARDLEYAIELNPNLATAYNWLAICRSFLGDIEGMFLAREQGLAVDPLHPVLLMNSADIHLSRDDFDSWKDQLLRLLDLPETPYFVYIVLSIKHEQYGYLPEALYWVKRMFLEFSTADPVIQFPRPVLIYEKLGMPDQADDWLKRMTGQSANITGLHDTQIQLLVARGQFDDLAIELYTLMDKLSIDPQNPPPEYVQILGQLLSLTGDFDTAIPLLERYLDIDQPVKDSKLFSEDTLLTHLLAWDYEQTGQADRAADMLDRAQQLTNKAFDSGLFTRFPENLLLKTLNLAARGELAAASDALAIAHEAGWVDYYAERHMPYWRGAWESEEFAPVVAAIVDTLEQQRAEVEADELENDFWLEFQTSQSRQ